MRAATFGLALLLGIQGCVSATVPHVSSMNFSPDSMAVIGKAEGKVTEYKILGIAAGDDTYCSGTAIDRALASVGGDALINTVIDVQGSSFLGYLFGWETIRAYGTAVSFTKTQPVFKNTAPTEAAPAPPAGGPPAR